MINNKDTKEIYLLSLIRKENGLIIDEVLLGIYTDLDILRNMTNGYILKNEEELYITKKKLNEKLSNRNINFENEEYMKINKDYWNKNKIIE